MASGGLLEVLAMLECSWDCLQQVADTLSRHLPEVPQSAVTAVKHALSIVHYGDGLVYHGYVSACTCLCTVNVCVRVL